MDTKAILKEKVTEFSPELQRLKKVDSITTDVSDSMSDLPEGAIVAGALLRALHENVIEIPATMSFLTNYTSLRRSRDRLGRQEFVNILKGRPSYVFNPHDFEDDQPKQPSFFQRITGFFRKKT